MDTSIPVPANSEVIAVEARVALTLGSLLKHEVLTAGSYHFFKGYNQPQGSRRAGTIKTNRLLSFRESYYQFAPCLFTCIQGSWLLTCGKKGVKKPESVGSKTTGATVYTKASNSPPSTMRRLDPSS